MAMSAEKRTTKRYLGALYLALGVLLSPIAVQASLISDTVGCSITGGGSFTCSSATAVVVNPGVEFQIGNLPSSPFFNIDFRSNDVLITNIDGTFTLAVTMLNLTDLSDAFTGSSLLSTSGVTGLNPGFVSFNAGTVVVDMRNAGMGAYIPGATIDIALTNAATAAPEPATASLISVGLIALAVIRRRRGCRINLGS